MKKLKTFTALLISITLLCGCSNVSLKETIANRKKEKQLLAESKEYLMDNYSTIPNYSVDDFQGLEMLDSELENHSIFFTGEQHAVDANKKLEMKFIHYFKEKANIKYILCESSYSNIYAVNKYLQTGDLSWLDNMFDELEGTFSWTKNKYNFYKELYEYNMTLPEEERLIMVGVDIEHQPYNAFECLNDMIPNTDPEDIISEDIKKIQSIDSNSTGSDLMDTTYDVTENIKKHEDSFKSYLGENFLGFKLVLHNILNLDAVYKVADSEWNSTRDKMIYDNFKILDDFLPEGKYYGEWGSVHILQAPEDGTKFFANLLNEDEKYKNKVLSISYNYKDCKYLSKPSNSSDKYVPRKNNCSYKSIDILDDTLSSDLNLYKLNSEDSPFNKIHIVSLDRARKKQNAYFTDSIQYVLTIKNSPADVPLGNK